jgi:hypothetical protein
MVLGNEGNMKEEKICRGLEMIYIKFKVYYKEYNNIF